MHTLGLPIDRLWYPPGRFEDDRDESSASGATEVAPAGPAAPHVSVGLCPMCGGFLRVRGDGQGAELWCDRDDALPGPWSGL